MRLFVISVGVLAFGFSSVAFADRKTSVVDAPVHVKTHDHNKQCEAKTTATITVSLSQAADSFKELSDYVETTRVDIVNHGKALGITDLKVKNSNFSINTQYNRYPQSAKTPYNLNGSIHYESSMTDKAIQLAEMLSEKDFRVTYNESMRRGYCPQHR